MSNHWPWAYMAEPSSLRQLLAPEEAAKWRMVYYCTQDALTDWHGIITYEVVWNEHMTAPGTYNA